MQQELELVELINGELDDAIEYSSNKPSWYSVKEAQRWYSIIEGELCVLVNICHANVNEEIIGKLNQLAELIGE